MKVLMSLLLTLEVSRGLFIDKLVDVVKPSSNGTIIDQFVDVVKPSSNGTIIDKFADIVIPNSNGTIIDKLVDVVKPSSDAIIFREDDEPDEPDESFSLPEIARWREVVDAVNQETEQLDDIVFKDDDEEEEEEKDDDLLNRLGETINMNMFVPKTVDCFGLPGPIAKALRFLFRASSTTHTRFYLSTRNQPESKEIKPGTNLSSSDFDPKRRTVFIIHGFLSNGNTSWVRNMTKALLSTGDVNVIAVDWSEGGGSWRYWKAVANTRVTGAEVTRFIKEIGVDPKNVHLIGHSLGAHICSYVASHLGGVSRITGLDPAQPCFQTRDPDIRLDSQDADFIDVIHTNGRNLLKVGLGMPQPVGHVDFYPNGGAKQPGCSKKLDSLLFPIYNYIKNKIEKAICSHGRSYMFFTEAIKRSDDCSFWGHRWNLDQSHSDEALISPCSATNCTEMGIVSDIFPARGSFYVATKARAPYCITDQRTDREMAESLSQFYRRSN